eukprot:CAMPEP_0117450432 /NCGR_PEP_ID=MMETSP0759-20121206/8465_1 /TAXON_ID=63605 /ORGANISM="Percolomonas cosmopolitus, Strain WS" /LENGTH=415 /DNA_ID=CAMNT_0005242953 /DNA_START=150 /DNA_END=1397 /DNA_ORIENTATION=-
MSSSSIPTTPQEKYALMTKNLQEIIGGQEIEAVLKERDAKIYWGTATTGSPHLGYFVPIIKIADFLLASQHVTILFADIHAFLDNMKSSWELLDHRVRYYEFIIKEMLKVMGVPLEKLRFVRGSEFQLSQEYTLDVYKMSSIVTASTAKHAGAEVVKKSDSPVLSGLLYPLLQGLDEQYLGVDIQFGGVDQRKLFAFARDNLPKIGYQKRAYLMNHLIPGLTQDGKMSSSIPNSKIDFTDSDKQIKKKISAAFAAPGQVEGNGLLAIMRFIIFRKLEQEGRDFVIDRPEEFGGMIVFKTYEELEQAYAQNTLSPQDLKLGVIPEVQNLVRPLREAIQTNQAIFDSAYPDTKKSKPKKDKVEKANPFVTFCNQQVKEAREQNPDEYTDMADKFLVRKLNLGRKFAQLSDEEKKQYL